MKVKTKLIASIMSICLVCAVFAIGVFALKTANLKIGGDVSFQATGVEASVVNATIIGMKDEGANSDFNMSEGDELIVNTSMTQSDIDLEFATWQGLDLTFNDNADDIVIKFDIANTSANADNYIEMDYDYSFSTDNPNIKVVPGDENEEGVWENNNYILAPKAIAQNATYTTITLKVRIINKELDVKPNTTLNLSIFLKHIVPAILEGGYYEDIYYSTTTTTTPYSATVSGKRNSPTDVVIPAVVSDGINNYIVTNIPIEGFYGWSSLSSLVMPNSIISSGGLIFGGTNIKTIYIPSSLTSLGYNPFDYSGLESIVVSNGNGVYDSRNNCNAVIETATNILVAGGKNSTIPEGIVTIADWANVGGGGECVVIPESVMVIGDHGFQNVSALKINSQAIVSKITSSDPYTLLGGSGATSLYIKEGLDVSGATYLTNIENFTPEKISDEVADADGDGYILYTKNA